MIALGRDGAKPESNGAGPDVAGRVAPGRWLGLKRALRWLAVGLAALGVGATVLAGLSLFAGRPRVDRPSVPPVRQAVAPAQAARSLRRAAETAALPRLRAPVAGSVLLGYGWGYSPLFDDWRFHVGVDLAASPGQPVLAAGAGHVAEVRQSRSFGGVVRLALDDGLTSTYKGLNGIEVQVGETVSTGQTLGFVASGVTAESYEPSHVHWEVSRGGQALDPESLVDSSG